MSGRHAAPERPDMKAPPGSPAGRGFCLRSSFPGKSCRARLDQGALRALQFPIQFSNSQGSSVVEPSLRAQRSNPWPQQRKHGLLRCARNDEESAHDFVLAAPCARAVDESSAQRGRGERRMPVAPAASCALVVVERTRVTTSTPESPDVPARNGFNGFLRALPGDRAVLPPSSADMSCLSPVGPT